MEVVNNIINLAKRNNTKVDYLACIDFLHKQIINQNTMNTNKYGWTEKRSFEQFYKEQLIRLYKKVSPFKCISFLNDKTTIEEISSEMDKLINEMGK